MKNFGPIQSSDKIIEAAAALSKSGRKKMVAVAGAQDADVIGALASANADGILDCVPGDPDNDKLIASGDFYREAQYLISELVPLDEQAPNR